MKNVNVEKKIKAYCIDWVFIVILCIVFSSFLMLLWYLFCSIIGKRDIFDNDIAYNIIYYTCIVFPVFIYPVFKDLIFKCGSIGCKISKIKIVNEDGEKPSRKQLLLRGLFFSLFWIDFFVSKKRLDNCSLTDIITKTRQVYLKKETGEEI